jgi:hypothetical protein
MHSVSEFAREPVEKENTLIRGGVVHAQSKCSVSELARDPVEKENKLLRRGVSTCQQQMEFPREPADVDLSI